MVWDCERMKKIKNVYKVKSLKRNSCEMEVVKVDKT